MRSAVFMERILVVEDDLALNAGLCFELDTGGYSSAAAYTCAKARYLVREERFSLALLDVNLPDGNGFDMGAEDYVTKPFNMKILLRRIEVALRRGKEKPSVPTDRWSDGFLLLDFSSLTAVRGGEKLAITPNEYKLLKTLTENSGRILTRQLLLERLWDSGGNFIDDHTLTVTMNRLRAKIEDEFSASSGSHKPDRLRHGRESGPLLSLLGTLFRRSSPFPWHDTALLSSAGQTPVPHDARRASAVSG